MGSALAAVVCVEIALRLAGPRLFSDSPAIPDALLGWSLRPNATGWETEENTIWFRINSAGFRDYERPIARTPGKLRIALIGDSYVHAYYAPLERTYAAYLERALAACAPGGVEVFSFGAAGYNTGQELLLYQHRVAAYRPDIVLLSFFTYNDITGNHPAFSNKLLPYFVLHDGRLTLDNSFRDKLPRPSRWPRARATLDWLRFRLRTVQLLSDRIEKWRQEPTLAREYHALLEDDVLDATIYSPPAIPEVAEAWRVTEALLEEFARQVTADHSEFWVVTLANALQVDPDLRRRQASRDEMHVDSLFYPDRRIARFAADHGIRIVPLAEPLAEYTAKTGEYLNGGMKLPLGEGHWNDTGNRVAAELTARQLCAQSPVLSGAAGNH